MKRNRRLNWVLGLVFMIAAFGLFHMEAHAGMKPKLIALNMSKETKIKEEIDGDGIKDEITIEIEKNDIGLYYFVLRINGDSFGPWTHRFDGAAMILITDIDDSDGKKEVWIGHDWKGRLHIHDVFSIGQNYFSTLYNKDSESSWAIPSISYDAAILSKGDGYITYEAEYSAKDLGKYLYYTQFQLTKDGLEPVGDIKCHKTIIEWQKDRPYKLMKRMKVYGEFRGKKLKFSLKKGDKVYIHELRFTKVKKDEHGDLNLYSPWALIKTKKGKSGWIKIPKGEFYKAPNGIGYERG